MGSELVMMSDEESAKRTKLGMAIRVVVDGGTCSLLKERLDQLAESKGELAHLYRISVNNSWQLMRQAKQALWQQNKEHPKETYAKHYARLEHLYQAAMADGNKSLALAIEDRLLALQGVDRESLSIKATERSRQLGNRLDTVLGNLSRAIASLVGSAPQLDSQLPADCHVAVDDPKPVDNSLDVAE